MAMGAIVAPEVGRTLAGWDLTLPGLPGGSGPVGQNQAFRSTM